MEPLKEPDHYPAYLSTDAERPVGAHELTLIHQWLAESIAHAQGQGHRRRMLIDVPELLAAHDSARAPFLESDQGVTLRLCLRLAGQLSRHLAPEPATPWLDSSVQQYWLAQLLGLPDAQDLVGRVLEYKARARFFPPGQLQARGLDQAGLMLRQLDACHEIAQQFERTLGAPDQLSLTLGGLYVQVAQLTGEYEKRSTPDDGMPKPSDKPASQAPYPFDAAAVAEHLRAGGALAFTYPTPTPPTPDV